MAAADYPIISAMTTTATYDQLVGEQWVTFNNTNGLVKSEDWRIDVSKTGFINESGKCLVMQAWLNNRPTVIVLLDALGRYTPMGDSNRIKKWLDNGLYSGEVYSALSPL
jgi:D-alanyl-D-alanine endopeptidase (penicillin-binding protein 7)